MNLDDTQKAKVREWIEQGAKLSEIQVKLASELNVKMTYMEVRFLMDDLKLNPKDKELPPAPKAVEPAASPQAAGLPTAQDMPAAPPETDEFNEPDDLPMDDAGMPGGSKVSVTVDKITKPGSAVSGSVTFTDGNTAQWHLDQFGRLGLSAKVAGYKPSQPDVLAFQMELQNQLAKLGF